MGHVHRGVRVVEDRDTGRSRGFAFVEFDTPQAAVDVIRDLDGYVVDGRTLRANEAEDKTRRGGGGREPGGSRRPPRVEGAGRSGGARNSRQGNRGVDEFIDDYSGPWRD
jgi:RNA recognition motif-containing protein